RAVVVVATILVFVALSEFSEFLPSLAIYKLLSLEKIILRVRPEDYFDDRLSSALQLGATSLASIAEEMGIYLAIAGIISYSDGSHRMESIRLAALVRIAVNSCVELVESAGKIAELRQLEGALAEKLTSRGSLSAIPPISGVCASPCVKMSGARFRRIDQSEVVLNVDAFEAKEEQIIAITGSVGAGKTTFIMAILGELELVSGNCQAQGSLAFVGQDPWIMGGTIRENILFGRAFERQRYNKIIRACCLESDFDQMEQGDQTTTGDKGVTLSGGQRARIALAR
ncbi:hypothetical protein GGH99_007221, partial [Coemansia sp. RSA 1285]